MLAGGNARSLGRTEQVVELVLSRHARLDELFDCVFHADEVVRMRAGDALEKVCRQKPELLEPFKERLLNDVPKVRQASVQWHLAQMFSEIHLNQSEKKRAVDILKHNLDTMDDWIVINLTLESLATFVREEAFGQDEFINILKQFQNGNHKSVASRANKLLKEFVSG